MAHEPKPSPHRDTRGGEGDRAHGERWSAGPGTLSSLRTLESMTLEILNEMAAKMPHPIAVVILPLKALKALRTSVARASSMLRFWAIVASIWLRLLPV